MPVPGGQPRGPAGESAELNPAYDPEGETGDLTRGVDPASSLRSGTETLSDRAEVPPVWALPGHRFPPVLEPSWNPSSPEREEDESKRGKYSQGSSRLLKRLLKEMEKAERGTDQQSERDAFQEGGYPTLPVPDALQEGGYPTLPVPDRGMQAAPTGMPGMNTGKSTEDAAHTSVRKRHIPVTVSAMLLPALVLAVGVVIWVLKNYLARKRGKRAAEEADGAGEGNETDSDPIKQESP